MSLQKAEHIVVAQFSFEVFRRAQGINAADTLHF